MHFLKCTSCSQEDFDLVNLFIYVSVCCVKMLEHALLWCGVSLGFVFILLHSLENFSSPVLSLWLEST